MTDKSEGATMVKLPLDKQALSGLRVIDFSWIVAGPQNTRILADFGAEVIKIENEASLDYARHIASPFANGSPNKSPLHSTLNRNKKASPKCHAPRRNGISQGTYLNFRCNC